MSFGDTINDPGDIKANGTSWQGLTGSQSVVSNAGPTVTFDVFDTMADGVRAVAKIIATHINRAGGSETVSQVATDYLGTSQNNAENPNVANYIQAVASGSGLSADSTVTTANIGQLVAGIFKGEGTASGVSQADISEGVSLAGYSGAFSGNEAGDSGFNSGFVNSDGQQATNTIAANKYGQSLISVGSATAAGVATASSHGAGTNASPASGILATLSSLLATWDSTSFVTRAVLVILGVLLLAAAFFAFTKQSVNINPADIAAAAA